MNIYDALRAVVAVQKSIAIDAPRALAVREAWFSRPPQNEVILANLPCWTNDWDFLREERHGSLREQFYAVVMQLHVARSTNGDNSLAAELATAFLPPTLEAFGARNAAGLGGITLVGLVDGALASTVTYTNIRGGSPTLGLLDPPGTIGLSLVLEIGMSDAFDYS